MKKFLLLTTLLLAATVFLAIKYFSNLNADSKLNDRILARIPQDAALVIEFTNERSIYEIFKDYTLFADIIGTGQQSKLERLKETLSGNQELAELFNEQKVYLSFHHDKDSLSFLWVSMLNEPVADERLSSLLGKTAIVGKSRNYSSIAIKGISEPFYFFRDENVVAGSFSLAVLQKSSELKETQLSPRFKEQLSSQTAGSKNSILNLYVDYSTVMPFLSKFYRTKLTDHYNLINELEGVSNLNMNFRSDALMFNGITEIDTIKPSYLGLFLHQKPVKGTLMRLLPLSTANSIRFSLSDYRKFETDLRSWFATEKELKSLTSQISSIARETGINPERDIRTLWGNEFATFQTANHERYGAVLVKDGRKLSFLLEPLSDEVTPEIRRLSYSNFFYFYFGEPFKSFRRPYYIITDNYLIIANSRGALQNYLDDYHRDNFLYKTPKYVAFESLQPNQSSISLFIHNGNSRGLIRSNLKNHYARNFRSSASKLNNFYGLSFQWSSDDGYFFTNLYLATNPDEELPPPLDSLILDTVQN